MMSAYVQQLAPSSYMGNCAAFQTADQLRRVQRVAYRTKQLALAHPARGFGQSERTIWEKREPWQAIRKAVEGLLVCYDWDDAFVGLNLVVKPVSDEIFLKIFGGIARENGAELDALINDNMYLDAERSRRWTAAMCKFVAKGNATNGTVLRERLAKWVPTAKIIAEAGGRLLAAYGKRSKPAEIEAAVSAGWSRVLEQVGLKDDA